MTEAAAKRAREASRDIDEWAAAHGLVLIELIAGEEPQEGVEFEVVALPPGVELP